MRSFATDLLFFYFHYYCAINSKKKKKQRKVFRILTKVRVTRLIGFVSNVPLAVERTEKNSWSWPV